MHFMEMNIRPNVSKKSTLKKKAGRQETVLGKGTQSGVGSESEGLVSHSVALDELLSHSSLPCCR